ncbi:aldolase/citrate lyase family protein [Flavobacteriaceae bacterium]|nr:aldolase/citrate lyase family protein [Flavobacteriaceae bacterium]
MLGTFSKTSDPLVVEAIANSGMDFIIIDLEHGYINYETLRNHLLALSNYKIKKIVRVPSSSYKYMYKSFELGSDSILVPNVKSVDEITNICNNVFFSPSGERGICKYVRDNHYGKNHVSKYLENSKNKEIIIQIEGKNSLDDFENFIKIDKIKNYMIGPYDLSNSLNIPGDINNPLIEHEVKNLINISKKNNISLGIYCDDWNEARKWKKLGINFVAINVDLSVILTSYKNILKKING